MEKVSDTKINLDEIDNEFTKYTFIRTLTETISLSILMILLIFMNNIISFIIFAISYLLLSLIHKIFIKPHQKINYLLSNILSVLIYGVLSLITYGIYSKFTTGLNIEAAVIFVMYANFIIMPFYFIINLIEDFINKNKELQVK